MSFNYKIPQSYRNSSSARQLTHDITYKEIDLKKIKEPAALLYIGVCNLTGHTLELMSYYFDSGQFKEEPSAKIGGYEGDLHFAGHRDGALAGCVGTMVYRIDNPDDKENDSRFALYFSYPFRGSFKSNIHVYRQHYTSKVVAEDWFDYLETHYTESNKTQSAAGYKVYTMTPQGDHVMFYSIGKD